MKNLNRDEAYKLSDSSAHRSYYDRWAKTYDEDFIKNTGYVYPYELTKHLLSRLAGDKHEIADIGCGTGILGSALKGTGLRIDGFDISQGMLNVAREKRVYRDLYCVDLSNKSEFPPCRYSALVSCGTFTLGHLGPSVLLETLSLCSKNAICVVGINGKHYDDEKFDNLLSKLELEGKIKDLEILTVPIYSQSSISSRNQEKRLKEAELCIFLTDYLFW